jgi:hypothetical protein
MRSALLIAVLCLLVLTPARAPADETDPPHSPWMVSAFGSGLVAPGDSLQLNVYATFTPPQAGPTTRAPTRASARSAPRAPDGDESHEATARSDWMKLNRSEVTRSCSAA